MSRWLRLGAVALAISTLGACAHVVPVGEAGAATPAPWGSADARSSYGVVTRIDGGRVAPQDQNPGAGAVLGGAIGAVIGRQIGGSSDARSAATLVGAVVGAIAGHHLEKGRSKDRVRATVMLDNGQQVTIEEGVDADLRIGERVRIENNRVYRVAQPQGLPRGRGADLQSPLA
jgi:outer membrane lipoprotein SlyB